MSSEASSSGRSKPITRSSIRHSLNLAGKALADVINKDGRDSDKAGKKVAKDTSSRRLSATATNTKQATPRASMGDSNRPPSIASRRTGTPDSKTVTRRRVSVAGAKLSLDEQPPKPTEQPPKPIEQPAKPTEATPQSSAVNNRSASLRPRSGVSALPKYRPKSIVGDAAKQPPSPTRAGVRRRLSDSDDEKDEEAAQHSKVESAAEKGLRPISPLPQRAAFKAKPVPSSSSKTKASPARPTKTVKTTASSNPTVPRPPSSSSSSNSFTPRTPKTPNGKSSPLRDSPQRDAESPLAQHSRKGSNLSAPSGANEVGNMSHISEGDSEDSETEHVELLLAPVAALGAPTPAMPRMLPSRANLSYFWKRYGGPGIHFVMGAACDRGIADVGGGGDRQYALGYPSPLPFRSGFPNLHLEVPDSPCLSTLNSPGEFGSISQVLLPDVTPSPAVHVNRFGNSNRESGVNGVDAAIVTLLRLQLASAENIAKERLFQLQSMEEEYTI
ncbi:hypothetical protein B0H10DRAFT_2210759 [Mycena sp. CBHHK59/15]|nr:hypothetical protein B0H10DRAFT_2210759 [Mycena sp. CBHHK59/15]